MNTPKNDRFQFQRNRFRKQLKKSLTKHIIISLLPKINIKITNLQNFFKKICGFNLFIQYFRHK